MLYKNDEPFKLDKQDQDAIRKHFHNKFPVKVVYPQERIVKSRLKHNRLPDKPNSISFDLRSLVTKKKDSNGKIVAIPTEEWRFAESVTTDKFGNKTYKPKKFLFSGRRFLNESDIELIYFLLRKSEFCLEGDNQGKRVKFMFEDLVTEAEKKAEKKKMEAKITNLLFGDDGMCLPIGKLRDVAKAMFIKGVDELKDAQVRVLVNDKIGDKRENVDKFLSMVNADLEIKSRKSIQSVIDMNKMVYDTQRRAWVWNVGGEGSKMITKVPAGENAYEVIVQYYQADVNFKEDVEALLLTGNKDAGKGKGKKEDET